MSVGDIAVQITLDGKNYSSAAGKVVALNKQIQKSVEDAGKSLESYGHSTVSQMQASSAAIRAFENPLGNNLRAVERFMTIIPGVGTALKAAFPVVGAVAFGAVIVESAKKVQEFISHLRAIPATVSMGAQTIQASMTSTNDELAVAIDRIEMANAKLEHKPINGLQLTLDEAAVAGDKLNAVLLQSNKEVQDLLKQSSTSGFIAQLIGNQASTAKTDDMVAQYNNRLKDIHGTGIDERYGAQGDQAKIAAAEANERAATRKAAVDLVKQTSAQLAANQSKVQQNIMNAGRFDSDNSHLNTVRQAAQSQILNIDQTNREEAGQKKNADDIEAKQKADDAKRAASEASAALRKAQEQVVQSMNAWHESFQNSAVRSAQDEMNFWAEQVVALGNGSKKYATAHTEAFKHLAESRQGVMRSTAEEQKKWQDATGYTDQYGDPQHPVDIATRYSPDLSKDSDALRGMTEAGKQSVERLKTMNQGIDLTRAFNDSIAEQKLALAAASGQMSAHDVAIQKMALHTKQYLDLVERMHKLGKSQGDIDRAGQDYTLEHNDDQASVLNTSFKGQWESTLNQMSNDFKDFGTELTGNFKQTIGNINGEIVKLLTTRHTNGYDTRQQFKSIGKEAFSGIADTGLKGIEGYGISGLQKFFGKSAKAPDGSAASPFHVIMASVAGAATGGVKSAVSGVGNFVPSVLGPLKSAGSSIGGLLGSAFQGFFADGGDVTANRPMVVGERGAEMFVPHVAGSIIPNNKLGGSTMHHHWNIDARGATNPGEVERAAMRAVMKAAPHIQKSSVKATHEYARRRPSGH